MSLLILVLIVLLVAGLAIYAVDLVFPAVPFNNLIKLLIVVIAIFVILTRAGLV